MRSNHIILHPISADVLDCIGFNTLRRRLTRAGSSPCIVAFGTAANSDICGFAVAALSPKTSVSV